MRWMALLPALAAAACTQTGRPAYMQDAPKTDEDVRRIFEGIKKELGDGFDVDRVDELFFVASNGSARSRENCKGTISRMYGYLYVDYFEKKPTKPIRVFLFKDKDSYDQYCKVTYERPPSTPFGFYMSGERKMVMNISTGTGTLAHELVHPLLAEDFAKVPSWFNEGFASLFEESAMKDGKMLGLTNWRLPGLQKAIRENRSISLKTLMKTDTETFYGDDRGVNYAAARYLCYWLQEKGLLREFYKEFKKTSKDDATGIAAFEKVAKLKIDDFEKDWTKWVTALK